MTEVECEYCGESFDKRGIGAHQRHCEDAEEAEAVPDDEFEGLEARVHERDDGLCVRCESESDLVIHEVDPDVGQVRANLVTICAVCESEIEGLHPRTKRTKIHHDG